MDAELVRAWQLIVELSEQNARNQKIANDLKAQANQLQVSASARRRPATEEQGYVGRSERNGDRILPPTL
jgi:hypothetical protein